MLLMARFADTRSNDLNLYSMTLVHIIVLARFVAPQNGLRLLKFMKARFPEIKANIAQKPFNENKDTILHQACENKESDHTLALVRYLIEEEGFEFDQATLTGTPLIKSAFSYNQQLCRYLIEEKGADVNKVDGSGNTSLYVAVYKGNISLTKYLLEKGADPSIRGVNGSTVLHVCAERNFHEIAKVILEKDPEKSKQLVFVQTEPNEDEEGGGCETALHVCCEWNSTETCELLFEYGGEALVKVKNGEGEDAIEKAYAENQEDIYRYLCHKTGQAGSWILCNIF